VICKCGLENQNSTEWISNLAEPLEGKRLWPDIQLQRLLVPQIFDLAHEQGITPQALEIRDFVQSLIKYV